MKAWIAIAVGLTAGRAAADAPAPRPSDDACEAGLAAAKRDDLSRAAYDFDVCDAATQDAPVTDDVARAEHLVRGKLAHSELSKLEIVTTPEGLYAETDAVPGLVVRTPATVWVHAGHHVIRAARQRDDLTSGKAVTNELDVKPHAHAMIVLDVSAPNPATPRAGKVDFSEENAGEAHAGPPPDVKHGSLLPCKYTGGCGPHGEQIDDPLAREDDFTPPHPASTRLGLRAGVAAAGHSGGSRIAPSIALQQWAEAPWEDIAARRPFELELRTDWSRRGGDDARLDVLGLSIGFAKVVADPDAAWLSAGVAIRGEARFGDLMGIERFGGAAAATLELALRRLPVAIGARYEQGFTALIDGVREHTIVIEVGADLRSFHYAE